MDSKKLSYKSVYANIRLVYIMIYMITLECVAFIPVRRLTDGHLSLLYNLIAISGAILLFSDFLTRRVIFKPKYCGLLILFVISVALSSICNMKYGIADNAKTIVWTCIQMFLLMAADTELPVETQKKHFRIITETYCGIWLIGCILSIYEFLIQYYAIWKLDGTVGKTVEGFFEGRLHGVFTDPNYASLCAVAAIVFAVLNTKKSLLGKIYHIFAIICFGVYTVLAGSRTTSLVLCIFAFLVGTFLAWNKLTSLIHIKAVQIIVSLLIGAVCVGIPILGEASVKYVSTQAANLYMDIADIDPSKREVYIDPAFRDQIHVPDNTGEISFDRPDVTESSDISNNRISIWTDYLNVFKKSPIVGTSPRNALAFAEDHFDSLFIIDRQYSIHNSYLAVLVSTGILGTLCLVPWAIATVIEIFGYIIRNRHRQDRFYRRIFLMSSLLVCFAIAAFPLMFVFFSNMIIDLIFWFSLGYTKSLIRSSEPEKYENEKETFTYRFLDKIFKKIFKRKTKQEA